MSEVDTKAINIYMSVTGPFAAQMATNGAAVQTFGNQANAGMAKAQVGVTRFGATAGKVAKGSMLAFAAMLALSAKVAIDFQDSFAGVRKTVDTSEAGFRMLADGVRELATIMPIGVNELNKIMELGGQLGVKPNDLLEFTETIAKIGVTTTLSTDEAATGFARLDNIMQLGGESFDRVGATVVDLGNNFAATEDEILRFALRVAPVGQTVGLVTDEVLAIATAFTSVGIPAERGGTAIQKTFIKIAEAAMNGGAELDIFSRTADMTSESFAKLVKNDPAAAFAAFVNGLADVGDSGRNVFAVLDSVGLGNERVRQSLLAMSNATGLLDEALRMSESAWEDNIALGIEADKRFGTFKSQMVTFKNKVQDLAIALGLELLPYLSDMISGLSIFFDWLVGLNPAIKTLTLSVLALVAALTLAKAHPIILGLTVVAGAFMLIGRNAARAKERVDILKKALEVGEIQKPDIESLLGTEWMKDLFKMGFTQSDISKALLGTKKEFEEFAALAQTAYNAMTFDPNAGLSTAGAKAPVIAAIEDVRTSIGLLTAEEAKLQAQRNRAKILGIELPGFDEERKKIEDARRVARSLYRGVGADNQAAIELFPMPLDDGQLGDVRDALSTYSGYIADAFSDVDDSIRDQIDAWYEFDDELDISFEEILKTLARQVTAIGDFETLIAELDLSPAVEKFVRDSFNTPALMEAFVSGFATGGDAFITGIGEELDRVAVIVQKKWERAIAGVEIVAGQQLLDDLKSVADEILADPENTYNPAEVWLGLINATIAEAGPGTRQNIIDLLIGAFGEGSALGSEIDLTKASIDELIAKLLELQGEYTVTVITAFPKAAGDDYLITPRTTTYPKAEPLASGGDAFKNRPYFVGERGPELFIPFTSGKIIPNSGLGSPKESVTNNASQSTTVIVQDSQHRDLRSDISAGLMAGGVNRQVEVLVKK